MVEIAISIAVVAFALVAIIGVLPTGFQVQRENREDTIIGQEGMLWTEAIRNGALGMDYLTNHVEFIQRIERRGTQVQTNTYRFGRDYWRGWEIIGLLTWPKYEEDQNGNWRMVRSQALVRALTGSAADLAPTNQLAFTYLLEVEAMPFNPFTPTQTNWNAGGLSPEETLVRSNYWALARQMEQNAWELKLTLRWPAELHPRLGLRTGQGHRTFRVLRSGVMAAAVTSQGLEARLLKPLQFKAQ
ncbi:MAG: hypothetical protein D6766_10920 [Verrucomicrobia bacterium]|nr:MAG: hypothetical protein D6766_10920 [Verrucomicrobiota bacterium]